MLMKSINLNIALIIMQTPVNNKQFQDKLTGRTIL